MLRGGHWRNGADAGVFYFGGPSRASVGWSVGFRSAYIPNIG